VLRHRAWTPWYLVRYLRLLRLRLTNPHVVVRGMAHVGVQQRRERVRRRAAEQLDRPRIHQRAQHR